jgi:hypothetical protein
MVGGVRCEQEVGGALLYPLSQCHGWDVSTLAWRLLALGTAERSRALERRDGGGRMCARSKAGVPASSGSANCAWSARGGDSSQGCCLHALVLSDVAVRFCSAGHVRRACAKRHATEVPSTEETRREGVGLAWLLTRDCTDRACRHAARPGHRGAAASRRRQRGSAEAIGDGAEASSVCPQMVAPAAGRGGVARGGPTEVLGATRVENWCRWADKPE